MKFDKYEKRGPGYHWRQISKSITERNVFVVARYSIARKQVENCSRQTILDVGCGDGCLSYLVSAKAARVVGLDTADEAIRFAKEKTQSVDNIEFIRASAYHLPFKRDSIGHVISADVLEHLEEPQKMLAEMQRVFDGTGKVIITTPLRLSEAPLDKMHLQEFFESDLRRLLSNHFSSDIQIVKSHPLVFMELQNRHFLVRYLFNLLNLLFRFNPFESTKGWRYYAMQTVVIEGASHKDRE